MNPLIRYFRYLMPSIESQHERDEAYLAASQDLLDLERRMRALDARGRGEYSPIAAGLYTR